MRKPWCIIVAVLSEREKGGKNGSKNIPSLGSFMTYVIINMTYVILIYLSVAII
jgi:hypothetical protein